MSAPLNPNNKYIQDQINIDLDDSHIVTSENKNLLTKCHDHDHDNCNNVEKNLAYPTGDANDNNNNDRDYRSIHNLRETIAKRRNMVFQRNAVYVRLFTMGMPFQGYLLTMFWLNQAVADHPFEYWCTIVLMTFFIAMSAVSYAYATYSKPFVQPRSQVNHIDSNSNSICKHCQKWKPERAHHCSTCNRCVPKMDHHCPWIVNCVGYKNHKSFLLFCWYMALAAIIYIYRTIFYLKWAFNNKTLFQHYIIFLMWWFVVTVIITPVFLMLGCLAFYHTILALNNSTTIGNIGGGGGIVKCPCIPDSCYDPLRHGVNKYNKGWISNLVDFFDNSYLLWWFPNTKSETDQGLYFEFIPNLLQIEVEYKRALLSNGKIPEPPKKPMSLSSFNYEEILQKARLSIENRQLLLEGQPISFKETLDD